MKNNRSTDLRCEACFYSLRGLAHFGVCPECGTRYGGVRKGRTVVAPDASEHRRAFLESIFSRGRGTAVLLLALGAAIIMLGIGRAAVRGFHRTVYGNGSGCIQTPQLIP